jgi:hypothetical protein
MVSSFSFFFFPYQAPPPTKSSKGPLNSSAAANDTHAHVGRMNAGYTPCKLS